MQLKHRVAVSKLAGNMYVLYRPMLVQTLRCAYHLSEVYILFQYRFRKPHYKIRSSSAREMSNSVRLADCIHAPAFNFSLSFFFFIIMFKNLFRQHSSSSEHPEGLRFVCKHACCISFFASTKQHSSVVRYFSSRWHGTATYFKLLI